MLAVKTKPGDMSQQLYIANTDITVMEVTNHILSNKSNTEITLLCPGITDKQIRCVRQAMNKGRLSKESVDSSMPMIGHETVVFKQ